MKPWVVLFSCTLMACSDISLSLEPGADEMKAAYMATDDVRLSNDLLGGAVQLTEFKKFECTRGENNLFRCRFYAKFALKEQKDDGAKLLSGLIGSGSSYLREAKFFKADSGNWVCTEVNPVENVTEVAQ
jgi:hypothetical protein